jgi:hypothetical protein
MRLGECDLPPDPGGTQGPAHLNPVPIAG